MPSVFFLMGSPWYKMSTPSRNVVWDFFGAVLEGLRGCCRCRSRGSGGDHWMDAAVPRYGKDFVRDVRAVLNVCVLFTTYPLFWALYDQQVR